MTTNKVCGKGKCKFTDEFCASGDCPYDTDNVAQANSQDLTEQWKKGELPTGDYYIIHYDGLEVIGEYVNGFGFVKFEPKKLLAPVPSYEEWQELNKQRNKFIRDIKDLAYIHEENKQLIQWVEEFNSLNVAQENQQLKELLKRARDSLEGVRCCIAERLVDEIDEVLNVSNE